MKESTKKKLIKTAKIAGMAMIAFFAVLGLAFSAAALNKCSGGEDRRTPIVTLNENRKLANEPNGLDSYVRGDYQHVGVRSVTDSSLTFSHYNADLHVYDLDFDTSFYIVASPLYILDIWHVSSLAEYEHLLTVLSQVRDTTDTSATYTVAELYSLDYYEIPRGGSRLIEPKEGEYWFVASIGYGLHGVKVYDLYNDAPIMSVNWGFQWFPWQMMGYAGSNPVILSSITGSFEEQHLIEHRYLDGFYFRSNGKLYNKIDIVYTWANGSELTDGSGKFYSVSNNNAWIIQEVRYYYNDNDFDWVANFSLFESPKNSYNIPAYGPLAWVSPAFRQIDIVYIADENALISTNTGSYTLSQWIEILLQPMSGDININVIQGGDPFSLMTTAFESMKGILSIAVLPGISLGLLLFLPIIAGIIVIILRVVKR